MERSLQSFLDYARPPHVERQQIDLETVVQNVLGLIRVRAERQRVEVQLVSPVAGVPISADVNQMQQVVLNLTLNALDAMPQGGRLTLTTSRRGDWAELIVADTGPGISEDMRERLFQPFATDKETGLGLGLVITRRILEAHGGEVTAENSTRGGAVFHVRLPVGERA